MFILVFEIWHMDNSINRCPCRTPEVPAVNVVKCLLILTSRGHYEPIGGHVKNVKNNDFSSETMFYWPTDVTYHLQKLKVHTGLKINVLHNYSNCVSYQNSLSGNFLLHQPVKANCNIYHSQVKFKYI